MGNGINEVHGSTWHRPEPTPQGPPVGPDGRLDIAELASDRAAASSPFGDDVEFPLPPESLTYQHPSAPDSHSAPSSSREH